MKDLQWIDDIVLENRSFTHDAAVNTECSVGGAELPKGCAAVIYRLLAGSAAEKGYKGLAEKIEKYLSGGDNFPALQFALWTRPKRIYLVGCDCSSLGYCSGILDKTAAQTKFPLDVERLLYGWTKMKEFIEKFYPDVEIVSVNPVGLKGMFKDIETQKR